MSSPVEQWTDNKYYSFIRSALRKAWLKYPNRYKTLNEARLPHKIVRRGKRCYCYECVECGGEHLGSNVVVDHIHPCGKLLSYDDFPLFVSNLFCGMDDLQVMCKPCHNIKTMEERGLNPHMVKFKKQKAKAQKEFLASLNLPEGKNAKERIEIYKEHLGI